MSSSSQRALIVHTGGGLGDVLLSGPVIDSLDASGFRVDFLARRGTAQAVAQHPKLNDLLTIDGKDPTTLGQMRHWAAELKKRDYQIVFLLWSTTRWAWTLFMSGIPRRVGQGSRLMYSFLFTDRVAIRSEAGDEKTHWTDILLDYPRQAGLAVVDPRLSFPLSAEAKKEAQSLVDEADFGELKGPLIGFHSGKGLPLGPSRWPVSHFAKLAGHLQEKLHARLILTGGPQETDLVSHISQALPLEHANLAGKTSLQVLAAIAQQCDLFVCPDSGPMHLATAVQTPVVGIYALDEDFPQRWAPFGVPHKIVRPPRPACRPGCKKPTCPDFKCYLKVSPQELGVAVEELLQQTQSGSQRNLP